MLPVGLPPYESVPPPYGPAPLPYEPFEFVTVPRKRRITVKRLIAGLAVIAMLAGVGGGVASVNKLRLNRDSWQAREGAQHQRADGLDTRLADTNATLDSTRTDLASSQQWATKASAALTGYQTCVNGLQSFLNRIAIGLSLLYVDPSLDSFASTVGTECGLALANHLTLPSPPSGV